MTHTGLSDGVISEDYRKTSSQEVEAIDADIVAMLVQKKSLPGCVRVVGRTVQNTITAPENISKRLLVFVNSEKGEKGWIYGDPNVVVFRKRKEVKKEETFQKAIRVEVPMRKDVKTG